MRLKLGAYVRVSTEEQAAAVEGSLDNQKYRLKAYLDLKNTQSKEWGAIVDYYIDDGFSAKDTRRPAYQRMMSDLRKKKIDMILITDLSRLSRNIFDFCTLMDDLEKHEAQFLSIKEQFDSSTPAGKMMIYNMINLAQFEREQISERVALGVHSRAMRGLLNGGRPILGYDLSPDKPGTFIVNEREAEDVRRIFNCFLATGSRAKAIQQLNEDGVKPKLAGSYGLLRIGDRWTAQTLGNLLSSAAYIGYREVNRSRRAKDQKRLKPHQQYKLVKASWPPIISEATFQRAQELLSEAHKLERVRLEGAEDRFYILSGILRCGECGSPLVGQVAFGFKKQYRYYGHTRAFRNSTCQFHRVAAKEVEAAVLEYIWTAAQEAGFLNMIERNFQESQNVKSLNVARDRRSITQEMKEIDLRIDGLLRVQAQSQSDAAVKHTVKLYEALISQKQSFEQRLELLNDGVDHDDRVSKSIKNIKSALDDFQRGFRKSKGAAQKLLIRNLLQQVVLTPEGLRIFMRIADKDRVPSHQVKLVRFDGGSEGGLPSLAIARKASGAEPNLEVVCSDNRKVGDASTTRTYDLLLRRQLLYPAELWHPRKNLRTLHFHDWRGKSRRSPGTPAGDREILRIFGGLPLIASGALKFDRDSPPGRLSVRFLPNSESRISECAGRFAVGSD